VAEDDVTGDWLKVKCIRTHEFVVGGWIAAPESSRRITGLLLGEFVDGALRYVGKVDSGFDAKSLRAIGDASSVLCAGFGFRHRSKAVRTEPSVEELYALKMRAGSPFQGTVPEPDAVFCTPDFRVPVEFVDFTEGGFLRRPVFSRFALFGYLAIGLGETGLRYGRDRAGIEGHRFLTFPRDLGWSRQIGPIPPKFAMP
jgi:ATP-dependent DNA ligase